MAYGHLELYSDYMVTPFLKSISILRDLGVVEVPGDLLGTGNFMNIPKVDPLAAFQRRDISTTSATRSFTEFATRSEKGVILHDDQAMSHPVGETIFSGANFKPVFLQQSGLGFARRAKQNLYRVAKAAIEAADTTDGTTASANIHIHDVYNATTAATMTRARLQAAKEKMGDAAGMLSVAVMHSHCWADLVADHLTNYKVEPISSIILDTGMILEEVVPTVLENVMGRIAYCKDLGMMILIDDDLEATSMTGTTYTYKSKYPTLLFGPNAMRLAFQRPPTFTEDMDINDARGATMKYRVEADYVAHLNGIKWNVTTTNPTDTQLGTKSNWDEDYKDHREVRCVKLITN